MSPARVACWSAALWCMACKATLPSAPDHAWAEPSPQGSPVEVCWLEYTHTSQPAGYALAGPSSRRSWEVTASGLLVRHPAGDLLIDLGNSTHFDEEIQSAGFISRQYLKLGPGGVRTQKTALQAMAEVGEKPAQLKGVILSHIHADHAGGLMDLPNVPVITSPEEVAFARVEKDRGDFAVVKVHAAELLARSAPLAFTDTPTRTSPPAPTTSAMARWCSCRCRDTLRGASARL